MTHRTWWSLSSGCMHRRTRWWVGGWRPPPRAWKFSGQTLFSGQPQVAQKSWTIKYISVQWKIPRQLCFSGQAQSCSKILNGKKYIQYSEKFQGKLCFQGKRKLIKILNVKSMFNTVKNFRASASCSKIVNGENIFNTVYIHLGAIRAIWASLVCNLDQSHDWLHGRNFWGHGGSVPHFFRWGGYNMPSPPTFLS